MLIKNPCFCLRTVHTGPPHDPQLSECNPPLLNSNFNVFMEPFCAMCNNKKQKAVDIFQFMPNPNYSYPKTVTVRRTGQRNPWSWSSPFPINVGRTAQRMIWSLSTLTTTRGTVKNKTVRDGNETSGKVRPFQSNNSSVVLKDAARSDTRLEPPFVKTDRDWTVNYWALVPKAHAQNYCLLRIDFQTDTFCLSYQPTYLDSWQVSWFG